MDYVPFPRFSSEKLAIWFAQVESVFTLNGIISDSDKYDYIVAQIPFEHSSLVEDILLNPPPESKYDHIKFEFIKRMSLFWLNKEKMQNEKPSEYLQRLTKLADTRVPIEIVLNIWLKNLPLPVREIVSLEPSGHVEIIGPMADKAMALLSPPQRVVPPNQFDIVLHRIDELAKQIRTMQWMFHNRGPEAQQLQVKQGREVALPSSTIDLKSAVDTKVGAQRVVCCYHEVRNDERDAGPRPIAQHPK